jgi:hypothetical protein
VTRTTTTRLIGEQSPNLNSRKTISLKLKLNLKRNLWLILLFEEINALKRQLKPEKTASSKKRMAEYILCNEINLTTSSDEGEQREYLFASSKPFSSSKTKLEKSYHPTTELVVSLIINNEEHLFRALADTGASSSIILEAFSSVPFIKIDDSNTTTWSTMGGKFTTNKTGFVTFSLPEFNLKKQMCSSWAFHVDDRSESSSTYDMIIGNQPRSPWRIRHNHELQ